MGKFPDILKKAMVTLVYKKDDMNDKAKLSFNDCIIYSIKSI